MSSHASSTGSNPWRLEPGTVIEGRYQIIRVLGEGGFATVYEARHTRIDSLVAVKVLRIDHTASDKDFVQRFLDEAKATASIRHPNIVAVHDFGLLPETGQPFMAMQRLVGHDLKHELRSNGPLDPPRAFHLFKGALAALGQAHSMGIIHKDLKPANLFLSEPNTPNEALVIMDFGIARVENAEHKTATGNFLGTPQYYAPEYIRHQIVTPALDVYQMGLILVEMFTGRPVVNTNDPFQCLHDHCTGSLSLPPFILESSLGPIVRQALRLNHQERFRDGYDFMSAMESVDPNSLDFEVSGSGHGAVAPALNPETGHGMQLHSNQRFQTGAGLSQPVPVPVGSSASYQTGASGAFAHSGQASYSQPGPMFTGQHTGHSMPGPPPQAAPPSKTPVAFIVAGVAVVLLVAGLAAGVFILKSPDPEQTPPPVARGAAKTPPSEPKPNPKPDPKEITPADAKQDQKNTDTTDQKNDDTTDPPKTPEIVPKPAGVGPCSGAVPPPAGAATITVTFETLPTGAPIINQGALLGKTPCTWTRTAQKEPLELKLRDPNTGKEVPISVPLSKSNTVSVDLKNPPPPKKIIKTQGNAAWKKRNGNGGKRVKTPSGDDNGGGNGGGAIGRERD